MHYSQNSQILLEEQHIFYVSRAPIPPGRTQKNKGTYNSTVAGHFSKAFLAELRQVIKNKSRQTSLRKNLIRENKTQVKIDDSETSPKAKLSTRRTVGGKSGCTPLVIIVILIVIIITIIIYYCYCFCRGREGGPRERAASCSCLSCRVTKGLCRLLQLRELLPRTVKGEKQGEAFWVLWFSLHNLSAFGGFLIGN